MVYGRNLQKTLQSFTSDAIMDYCPIFDEIKTVLEYCNKNVMPFNKLHFRSGNEAIVNEICRQLQDVLVNGNFIDRENKAPLPGTELALHKVLMFLLANTDCTYKYNLREDNGLTHLLEVCPLMPKFLIVALIWDLQLDSCFYHMLSYTPCWFSFQYFGVAFESLKYIDDPFVVLERVEHLMRSILISISRSTLRKIDVVDQKIIYDKLDACAMNLLRRFYTPDADKFEHFTKHQMVRYSGFALKHLLQMLLFAFDLFEHATESRPSIDTDIYEICLDACKRATASSKELQAGLQQAQLKIIRALLNSLQNNVLSVTIDVFMYWVEIDLPDDENMQKVVGELAYKVCERIAKNKQFAHDVQKQLNMIAIRPPSLQECISAAKIGDILRTLDRPLAVEVKQAWFDELFLRMEALGNSECIETMQENVALMSRKHCELVLEFIKLESERQQQHCTESDNEAGGEMSVNGDELEGLCALLRLAVHNISTDDLQKLLEYKEKLFSDAVAISLFRVSAEDLEQRTTEYFNKLTAVFEPQRILCMCFEDPTLVWRRFFEASCYNPALIKPFCQAVQETRPYSDTYYNRFLNDTILDAAQQDKYFPNLLCEIYYTLYYPQKRLEFLKEFVDGNVSQLLDTQSFEALLTVVKALNLIARRSESHSYKSLNFGDVTAPILVLVGRIMDKSRWDLVNYTDERDEVVRDCIQFLQHNVKGFLPVASDKDRKWITRAVKESFRPLTQYYYQKFALTPDQSTVYFDRFLMRCEKTDQLREPERFLVKHYVRCTLKETEWLAQSELLLPHISNAMLLLGGIVAENNTANASCNYRHCLVNYANILKKFLLPRVAHQGEVQVKELLMKVLRTIAVVQTDIYDEIFMSFESILIELAQHLKSELPDNMSTVQAYLDTMPDCSAKAVFQRKFNALLEIVN